MHVIPRVVLYAGYDIGAGLARLLLYTKYTSTTEGIAQVLNSCPLKLCWPAQER
jgi:hypothetical protein